VKKGQCFGRFSSLST